MSIPLIIILVIVVVLVVAVIGLYNNLVKLRNMVDNAWAQIDVQLQRRLDLIPNLVETVKGYAAHESGTLEEVTKARTAVMNAPTPEGKMQADGFLTGALKNLFAVASKLSRCLKPIMPAMSTAGNVWIAVLYFMTVSLKLWRM